MSENLKNIDIIYRKELSNYSQSAPEDVWSNIERELDQQKKSSFHVLYKVAAAIISITLIGAAYLYFNKTTGFDQLQVAENTIVNEEKPATGYIENIPVADEKTKPASEDKENLSKEKSIIAYNNQESEVQENNVLAKAEDNNIRDNSNLERIESYQILFSINKPHVGIVDNRKQKIERLISSLIDINPSLTIANITEQPKEKKNKWALGGEFTPLYSYRHISETENKSFYNDLEDPVMSYSGGLNFQYKPEGRLTFQVGVYYSTMGQSLNYVDVYENSAFVLVPDEFKDRYLNAYSLENSTGGIVVNSEYAFVDKKAERVSNLSASKSEMDVSNSVYNNIDAEIKQSYQYIELPFLLRYKIIDKLIDVNFVGGIGANFLIGNDVFISYGDNEKDIIGHTEGVRDVNYNGTLGLGFEYPLMKHIIIRFEPSIKYYLNEINPTSEVESHPYSIGLYTGINYSF